MTRLERNLEVVRLRRRVGRGHGRAGDGLRRRLRGAVAVRPVRLVQNWMRLPGTSRISVENRSLSSPSRFQRRVWSLPAT